MTVRPAAPEDLAEIAALIRELAEYERLSDMVAWSDPEELRPHLFGDDAVARVLLAIADAGSVAGFALWFPTFSTFLARPGVWLEDVFVRPEHRRRGHARDLLAALRSLTDGRVEWSVLDWNESAQHFYRSLGAAPVDGWTTWRSASDD